MSKKKNNELRKLRDQLFQDRHRPDGRWGIHGNQCVDDDYFLALDYVIDEMNKILGDEPEAIEWEPAVDASSMENPGYLSYRINKTDNNGKIIPGEWIDVKTNEHFTIEGLSPETSYNIEWRTLDGRLLKVNN